jgi:hypothetical protein
MVYIRLYFCCYLKRVWALRAVVMKNVVCDAV